MRTRTHLTTPEGQQPEAILVDPDAAGAVDDADVYVPSFALPSEPRPPGRYRTHGIVLASLLLLVVLGWAVLQLITAGSDFDPALSEVPGDAPADQPAELPDGGEG